MADSCKKYIANTTWNISKWNNVTCQVYGIKQSNCSLHKFARWIQEQNLMSWPILTNANNFGENPKTNIDSVPTISKAN